MDAAGARKRMERLAALIAGLAKEAEAVLADRGVLTLEDWNSYLTAIYNAKDALHAARTALQMAARRRYASRAAERLSHACPPPSTGERARH
jgi:hypothetical protein